MMPGTPLLTIAGSVAAFTLGFQLFQGNEPPGPSAAPITLTAALNVVSVTTAATSTQEPAKPPVPLDLLTEVTFTHFGPDLNFTAEARLLLGINKDEAEAVTKAAQALLAIPLNSPNRKLRKPGIKIP